MGHVLLEFVEVTGFHPLLPPFAFDDASGETFRDVPLWILMNVARLGLGDHPPGRRQAYIDLLLFSAEPGPVLDQRRRDLADCPVTDQGCLNSSCAMLVRALWRLLGSRSATLDPLSVATVMTDLLRFAAEAEAGEPVSRDELMQLKGQVKYSELKRLEHLPPDPPDPPAPPEPPPADASPAEREEYLALQAAYRDRKRDHLHARAEFEARRAAYDAFLVDLAKGRAARPVEPPALPAPATPDTRPEDLSFDDERAAYPAEAAWHARARRQHERDEARRDKDDVTDRVLQRQASKGAPLVRPDGEGFSKAQLLDLDPRPGDVIFIFKAPAQHVFTVVHREGDVFYSVDGGYAGGDDGRCCGIDWVQRTLQEGSPAVFVRDDKQRPIVGLIRFERLVDKLAFGDAPVTLVKVTRDQAGLAPTPPAASAPP